jgi:hypothetical protein
MSRRCPLPSPPGHTSMHEFGSVEVALSAIVNKNHFEHWIKRVAPHISLLDRSDLSGEICCQTTRALLDGRLRPADHLSASRDLARALSTENPLVASNDQSGVTPRFRAHIAKPPESWIWPTLAGVVRSTSPACSTVHVC